MDEGQIHRPYTVKPHIVLFDTAQLADDWERIKEGGGPKVNKWDRLLNND